MPGRLSRPLSAATSWVASLERVAQEMGLASDGCASNAPPLPDLDLDLDLDDTTDRRRDCAASWPATIDPIGLARISRGCRTGDGDGARTGARVPGGPRSRPGGVAPTSQLNALDEAVRGISGVLDLDRVLQLITDHVRDLAAAQYAAIGIVDADGAIERFITSGISDEERARIGDLPRGRGLLGLIIRENQSYRIPDIGDHPRAYGFPPNHPRDASRSSACRSTPAVPLLDGCT